MQLHVRLPQQRLLFTICLCSGKKDHTVSWSPMNFWCLLCFRVLIATTHLNERIVEQILFLRLQPVRVTHVGLELDRQQKAPILNRKCKILQMWTEGYEAHHKLTKVSKVSTLAASHTATLEYTFPTDKADFTIVSFQCCTHGNLILHFLGNSTHNLTAQKRAGNRQKAMKL